MEAKEFIILEFKKWGLIKMNKCVYCKKEYTEHKGTTLVMNSGKINHFCSAKCRKNMLMKRRKVRWVSKVKKVKKE